jgi:preprotein translocase subunit YajC
MLLALLMFLAPDPAPAQSAADKAEAKQEKNDKDAARPAEAQPDEKDKKEGATKGAPQPSLAESLSSILPLVLIGLVFYFLLIRGPMKRQEAERNALMASLKKNDKVLTHSGIYGTVVAIGEGDEITVKVDDNVRLRMTKGSILRKIEDPKQGAAKEGGA